MKKIIWNFIIILILSIACIAEIKCQEQAYKYSYSFGTGLTLFGLGDVTMVNIENQLNYKASRYFETSVSLQYYTGLTTYDHFASAGLVCNVNAYFLPFKNTGKYVLKMGGGISGLNYNGVGTKVGRWVNGVFMVEEYGIDKFNKVGFNLIVENSYAITKRHAIGLKMFIQSYSNADINSGGLLKLEYQF